MAEVVPNLLKRQSFRHQSPCTCMAQRMRTKMSCPCSDLPQPSSDEMVHGALTHSPMWCVESKE
jgi:hypothetical protein